MPAGAAVLNEFFMTLETGLRGGGGGAGGVKVRFYADIEFEIRLGGKVPSHGRSLVRRTNWPRIQPQEPELAQRALVSSSPSTASPVYHKSQTV